MRRSSSPNSHGSAGSSSLATITPASPSGSSSSQMHHLEQQARVLEAAYLEERHQRDQLEKKYARLKRRFLRLERAHAKLLVATHEVRPVARSCIVAHV